MNYCIWTSIYGPLSYPFGRLRRTPQIPDALCKIQVTLSHTHPHKHTHTNTHIHCLPAQVTKRFRLFIAKPYAQKNAQFYWSSNRSYRLNRKLWKLTKISMKITVLKWNFILICMPFICLIITSIIQCFTFKLNLQINGLIVLSILNP